MESKPIFVSGAMLDKDWVNRQKEFDELFQRYIKKLNERAIAPPVFVSAREFVGLSHDLKREIFQLLAILRDETQSRTVHERTMSALQQLGRL